MHIRDIITKYITKKTSFEISEFEIDPPSRHSAILCQVGGRDDAVDGDADTGEPAPAAGSDACLAELRGWDADQHQQPRQAGL